MRTVTKTTKGGDPNEAAVRNLIRMQQAYLDALAASGIPPYMKGVTENRQYIRDWSTFQRSVSGNDPLETDAKLAQLHKLGMSFHKEAKRLKELGLIKDIREIGYHSYPSYGSGDPDKLEGMKTAWGDDLVYQRQHGARFNVYDIVLPPKRKPPGPAPETLNKIGPRTAPSLRGSGELVRPKGPQAIKKEEPKVDDEVKKRRQMIMRGSKYRRKLFGPSKGQLIAKKRKFRK
mgnify:CR=1 FL=1